MGQEQGWTILGKGPYLFHLVVAKIPLSPHTSTPSLDLLPTLLRQLVTSHLAPHIHPMGVKLSFLFLCQENKSRQIRQFHFHGWPEVGIPSDGKGMINIIAAVQKQQQQSGNHPITVHCR